MIKVLDFYAPWCNPCKVMLPLVEKIAAELGVTLEKVNIDEDMATALRYGIRSVPTIAILRKDGELVSKVSGVIKEETLRKLILEFMAYDSRND